MIALRVSHNGNEVCTAGIGELGVISSHVTWVHSEEFRDESSQELVTRTELDLGVGGLHTPSNKHRRWDCPALEIGDEVTVEVVEVDDVTPHDHEHGMSKEADLEREKQYLRDRVKDLGWKLIEG
jgi:hypothetical protein